MSPRLYFSILELDWRIDSALPTHQGNAQLTVAIIGDPIFERNEAWVLTTARYERFASSLTKPLF